MADSSTIGCNFLLYETFGVMKMEMTVREFLFRDMKGCMDGNCVVTGKRTGMHTNGGCHCIQNLGRAHMSILASRLSVIADKKVNLDSV